MTDFLTLAGYGGACVAAGLTGVLFKPGAWYAGLRKPAWTPPNILFPIAWTTLYVLMALAAWRVAGRVGVAMVGDADAIRAGAGLSFWTLQITLNALWSPVFFGLHRPKPALVVIVLMWAALGLTVWGFWAIDMWAALMMVPTMLWGAYAAGLNLAVWRLNPPTAFGLASFAPAGPDGRG